MRREIVTGWGVVPRAKHHGFEIDRAHFSALERLALKERRRYRRYDSPVAWSPEGVVDDPISPPQVFLELLCTAATIHPHIDRCGVVGARTDSSSSPRQKC